MSDELDPHRTSAPSRENLLVLLLGATLFAAGAVLISFAIYESVAASAGIIAHHPAGDR